MFSDARSLWSTATTAFATLNENLSTALEKIDAEIDAQERSAGSTGGDAEQLAADLEAYKNLLDEAQMQHFELSKQSRILVAEKEAEIQVLKAQLGSGGSGALNANSEESNLKYQKLLAEKLSLEASLGEAQEELKRCVRERNESTAIKKTHNDLQSRFQAVKADLLALKAESEAKEKQKNETIENLVAEYSKLAAEAELYQQQADQRVAEVVKENEVLVTKMHALEHSITELADRTISPSPPVTSSSSSIATAGLSTPISSRGGSRAELPSLPNSGGTTTMEGELKEARAKIVNLQFDIKEKEGEIMKLKAAAEAALAAPQVAPASPTKSDNAEMTTRLREEAARCEDLSRKLQKMQQDLENQSRDLDRLRVEKREADEAGRKYLEQSKQVQAQCDALVRQQRQQQEAVASGQQSASEAASKRVTELQAELDTLRTQLAAAQAQHQAALATAQQERQSLEQKHREEVAALQAVHARASEGLRANSGSELAALQQKVEELTMQLASSNAAHSSQIAEMQQTHAQALNSVEQERDRVAAELAAKVAEMVALTTAHAEQLRASQSGSDAQHQSVLAEHMSQIGALKSEIAKLQDEINTATAAAAADKKQADNDKSSLSAALADSKARETTAAAKIAELESLLQASGAGHDQLVTALRADLQRVQCELASALARAEQDKAQAAAASEAQQQAAEELQKQLADAVAARAVSEQAVADKTAEIEKVRAESEVKLLAAGATADSDRQALVAEYTQQIGALKEAVAAAERQLTDRDAQVGRLSEELRAAQTESAALSERVAQLTAELAAAHSATEALKVEHAAELQTQEAAAQERLEGERAALQQQLRDCEESIGVLRDQHREELQTELEAQKVLLTEEHRAAQEQALAAAARAAADAQHAALDAQKQTLESDFTAQTQEALRVAKAEQEAAVQANTATLQAEREAALVAQATAHAQELAAQLADLTVKKDAETSLALDKLRQEKKQELEAALAEARDAAAAKLQSVEADYQAQVAALNSKIEGLQAELANADARQKEITAQALAEQQVRKEAEKALALVALRQELQGAIDTAYRERDEHLENYSKERKLRKKIHNRLLEIQGNIRVLCRVRPILEVERRSGEDVDVTEVPNDEELYVQRDQQCRTRYEYDRVFPQTSTQEEVFEAVQPLCVSVLDGYNVCIFAYGQTGSGKTFTMEGSAANKGVSPRAIEELLTQIESMKDQYSYTVTLSMLEIYNETILDLLPVNPNAKEKEKLEIRQTPDGNQVVGLTETTITSMAQVEELMRQGQKNRAVGSHDMNEHSSRSHSIITVVCRGKNLIDNTTTYGKLHLIDLAGSERVGKTDATGDRLKEAQNINKSLSALGEVINALGNKKATHVPYRNSKLTFLLQDSLGGNSKVLTFVNISPAVYNLGETVCSLNFATRCRSTELGQAKKQSGPAGEESAVKAVRRLPSSASNTSLNSSAIMTPAAKK